MVSLPIYVGLVWFGLLAFYGISTLVGYCCGPQKGSLMKTRILDNRLSYTRKIELRRKGKKSCTVWITPILICLLVAKSLSTNNGEKSPLWWDGLGSHNSYLMPNPVYIKYTRFVNILLIMFLNKLEFNFLFLYTIKWFQVLLSNMNNSDSYKPFVCIQLNGFKYYNVTVTI